MFSTLIISCLFASSLSAVSEKSKYTTKYDNVDLEEIVHSDRLLKNYVNCLLEKGQCTPDGLELKSKLLINSKNIKFLNYRSLLKGFFPLTE